MRERDEHCKEPRWWMVYWILTRSNDSMIILHQAEASITWQMRFHDCCLFLEQFDCKPFTKVHLLHAKINVPDSRPHRTAPESLHAAQKLDKRLIYRISSATEAVGDLLLPPKRYCIYLIDVNVKQPFSPFFNRKTVHTLFPPIDCTRFVRSRKFIFFDFA
jgi:hypothetical protein